MKKIIEFILLSPSGMNIFLNKQCHKITSIPNWYAQVCLNIYFIKFQKIVYLYAVYLYSYQSKTENVRLFKTVQSGITLN